MSADVVDNSHLPLDPATSVRLRILAWAALPVLAIAYYLLVVSSVAPLPKLIALEIIQCTPIALTVVWSLKARALSEGGERVFWTSMAIANSILISCELLLVWWVVVLNPAGPPRVSWPFHVLHAIAAGAFIVGITALSRFSVASIASRARWVLDSLAIAIVGAIALLELYVRPVMQPAGGTLPEILLGVGYPLFGLVMVGATLGNIVGFKVDRWRSWDKLVAASLVIYAAAISLWPLWFTTAVETSRNYQRGVLDLVQFSGHFLLMAAAVYRLTEVREWKLQPLPPYSGPQRRWATAIVPTLLLVSVPMMGYLAYVNMGDSAWVPVYVAAFTTLTALALARSVFIALENGALFHQSVTDPLTGLHNHRFFHGRLAEEMERARRYHETLSVLLIDLDDFAQVNARYGHSEGERLLQAVATALRSRCNTDCAVARTGGDDFAVIAPRTDVLEATLLARALIDQISIGAGAEPGMLSASAGIATFPDHATEPDELLRVAQAALQSAKCSGGEMVVVIDPHAEGIDAEASLGRMSGREAEAASARTLYVALQRRDPNAAQHAESVAKTAVGIGRGMGMDADGLWRLEWAARLHGTGLLSDERPWRPDPAEEPSLVDRRRDAGLALLSAAALGELVAPLRAVAERWDGCGLPHGLMGEEIPVESRIIAVAHAYDDALSTTASGTRALVAFRQVETRADSDFDPAAVRALARDLGIEPVL